MNQLTDTITTTGEREELAQLASKLLEVMDEVDYVQKSGKNTHHNYSYITERDLTEKIRGPLIEQGLMIFTSVKETDQDINDDITRVTTEHAIMDADTGATIVMQSRGHGQNSQDKGPYQAVTGAVKYFYYKLLAIPAGDDPEEPKYISQKRVNGLVSKAEDWGVSRDDLEHEISSRLGIPDVEKIHVDQTRAVWSVIQEIGISPEKNEQSE